MISIRLTELMNAIRLSEQVENIANTSARDEWQTLL